MIPPEETIFPSLFILISHFSKKIFFNLHMLLSFLFLFFHLLLKKVLR